MAGAFASSSGLALGELPAGAASMRASRRLLRASASAARTASACATGLNLDAERNAISIPPRCLNSLASSPETPAKTTSFLSAALAAAVAVAAAAVFAIRSSSSPSFAARAASAAASAFATAERRASI